MTRSQNTGCISTCSLPDMELATQPTAQPPTQPTAQPNLQTRAINACLQGLSPASRTVYRSRILAWLASPHGTTLDRETVRSYLRAQELVGAGPAVLNQTLAALKRLAYEAGELGWIDGTTAAQIARIKSKRATGTKTGIWLTTAQVVQILSAPDHATATGRRDLAVLALLIGCGLRRAEACSLTTEQLKAVGTEGRLVITNVRGKGGRVRSVAVPLWAAQMIDEWIIEL